MHSDHLSPPIVKGCIAFGAVRAGRGITAGLRERRHDEAYRGGKKPRTGQRPDAFCGAGAAEALQRAGIADDAEQVSSALVTGACAGAGISIR